MRRFIVFLFISINITVLNSAIMTIDSRADEINLRTEFEYSNTQSETTDGSTGDVTENDFSSFTHLYNIDVSKSIYPNLTISGGGIFEAENSRTKSDGSLTEREEERIRPFADVDLRSQIFDAGAGFRRTRLEEKLTGLPTAKNYQDDLNTYLKWRPAGLPLVRFFYDRTHNYDDIETFDQIENSMTLKMNYIALKKHPVNYTYNRTEDEDRLNEFKTVIQTHDGNVAYSRSFFKQRLIMDTSYKVRYRTTTFTGGDVTAATELSPFAGLYAADDSPQDGPALTTVTALIDGNVTASAGVNLGWTASIEEDRNIGFDFGIPAGVQKIYIYVDRNLSAAVSGAFSWAVYTSPDNTDTSSWTLHGVFPASFGTFQNRFEISFPEVTARFIKVVTSPLPSTFIIDPDLENIFVTEIEAFTVTSTADEEEIDSIDQNYGFNLVGRPFDDTVVGYNFFYTLRETDPSTEKSSLNNGVYANVTINRIFSYIARFTRGDDKSTVGSNTERSVNYTYSALLRAAWLETFEQVLTYSGNKLDEEEGTTKSNTIFVRNNAKLYKGWNAFFDASYSWSMPLEGGDSTATTLRVGTNIVPHKKINFDITYSTTEESIKNGEETSTREQELDFRTLYYPYRTLTFFVKFNVQESDENDERKVLQNYSASWSPFPDGDLQFFLTYNETLRSADDQEERVMGPSLKWNIGSHAKLDVFYFLTKVRSKLDTTDSQSLKMTLTLTF